MKPKFKKGDLVRPTKRTPKEILNAWPTKNGKYVKMKIRYISYEDQTRLLYNIFPDLFDLYSYELKGV